MGYSVVSGTYINRLYGNYRNYASGAVRKGAANETLVLADSTALRRGAAAMSKLDFGSLTETDSSEDNKLFYNNFRAFMDTLNNTLDSSGDSSFSDIKKLSKQIKNLSKEYETELAKLGISIDEKGYWSVNRDVFEAVDNKKFEKLFGEESEFSDSVKTLAKRLRKRVNTLV